MQIECFPDAPSGWTRYVFNEVAQVNPRYRLDKRKEYPFVEMASVAENFGGIQHFDLRHAEGSGLSRFKLNDILFGKITPCAENGKVALVKELSDEFGLGSTEFVVLSPRSGFEPRYVYALACSTPVLGRAISRMEGSTGRLRVTDDTFNKWLVVAVPELPEQQAIAGVLDAVDVAIQRTRTAITTAELLKRAVIQNFFEQGLGRISSADRPGKKLRKGWRLVSTGQLLVRDPKNGISPVATPQPPGFPTFSIAAVRNGKIDLMNEEHRKYVRIRDEVAAEFAVKRGDLLVVRGNANPELVGRCGMVGDHPEGCIYPDILKRVVFREGEDGVVPEFACIAWNHSVVHNQVLKRAKTSNGTLKINSKDVKQIIMPVPPKPEQAQLVDLAGRAESSLQIFHRRDVQLERLKRGLMQDLLTGRVRIKLPASSGNGVTRSRP